MTSTFTSVLEDTSVRDDLRTIRLEDLPEVDPRHPLRLAAATPLLEHLWRMALFDCEINIVERDGLRFFGAGDNFGDGIFTRDICYSGILGLNRVYPDLMWDSLEATRTIRRQLGFKVPRGYAAEEIDAPWEIVDLSREVFQARFGTAPISQRTDDVVWLWCAADLLRRDSGDERRREWVYEEGRHFFEAFYDFWHDPEDGLYRGQSSFIDVHFLDKVATGYPPEWTPVDCVMIKALSTNCLYVRGLQAMAELAEGLGRHEEARCWGDRRDALVAAIRRELRFPDGTFSYFKHADGRLEQRREALGTAFTVLLGVVDGPDATAALADYPVTGKGVPIFHPFFDREAWYHNNSSWPFVDTFFFMALEQSDGVDRSEQNLAVLARTCVNDDLVGRWKFDENGELREGRRYDPGSFHELTDFRTGDIKGSANQLWTAAAFIGTCFRAGLVEDAPRVSPSESTRSKGDRNA